MVFFAAFIFFCLGAILASFGAVITERMYTGQSWVSGRSRCDSCGRTLTARDLVPVVSMLISRGRCRTCKSRLSIRYMLGEVVLGGLFAAAFLTLGVTIALLCFLVALWVLYMIVLYDLRHMIVPPVFSALLIASSFCFSVLRSASWVAFAPTFTTAFLIGLGFLLLFGLSRGRAMGLGDAPVAFALALLVGERALSGLVFSFWIGGIIGLYILVKHPKGHRMGIEVPFVPFLAAGFLLSFFTVWNPFAPW